MDRANTVKTAAWGKRARRLGRAPGGTLKAPA